MSGLTITSPTSGYVGDVYARITADIRPIKADLRKVQDELRKMKKVSAESMGSAATSVDDMHSAVRRLANGMTTAFRILLAFKATAAVAKSAWEAVMASARAEEIENKFVQTFDTMKINANDMATTLAKDFDLANSTAKNLLATTGDLLAGFGFTDKQASELANTANRLALDLVSFQNIEGGAEYASDALTKAMLGNTRQAKQLGIVIRQDTDEFRNQVRALMDANDWTIQQAKAVAILEESVKQSLNAIGDYARTQESTMNVTRAASESWKELKESIGDALKIIVEGTGSIGVLRDTMGGFAYMIRNYVEIITGNISDTNPLANLVRDLDQLAAIKAGTLIIEERRAAKTAQLDKEELDRANARKKAEEDRQAFIKQNIQDAKKMERAFEMMEEARVREWKANLQNLTILNRIVSIVSREKELREEIKNASDPVKMAQAEIDYSNNIKLKINTLNEFRKSLQDLSRDEKSSREQLMMNFSSKEKQEQMLLEKRRSLMEKIAKSGDLEERKRLNLELLGVERQRLEMIEKEDKLSRNARFGAALVKGTQEAYSAELQGYLAPQMQKNTQVDDMLRQIMKDQNSIHESNNKLLAKIEKALSKQGLTLVKEEFRR